MKEIYEMKGAGRSVRGIAGELGIARNTVRRYLKSPEAIRAKPRPQRASKLDPYVVIQVLQASVIHKHPATLNTRGLHLYQFAVGWSITPFAFSRAR